MEQDAEEMAKLQCEGMQIAMGGALDAMGGGSADMKAITAHSEKVEKFTAKMLNKYESFEDKQKFHALVMEKSMETCLWEQKYCEWITHNTKVK